MGLMARRAARRARYGVPQPFVEMGRTVREFFIGLLIIFGLAAIPIIGIIIHYFITH